MYIYIIFICAIVVALVDICILNYKNRRYRAFIDRILTDLLTRIANEGEIHQEENENNAE